jgi:hypothetical protein
MVVISPLRLNAKELQLSKLGELQGVKWGASPNSVKRVYTDIEFGYSQGDYNNPEITIDYSFDKFLGIKGNSHLKFFKGNFYSIIVVFDINESDWMGVCSKANSSVIRLFGGVVYDGLRYARFQAWATKRWTLLDKFAIESPISVYETSTSYMRLWCSDSGVSMQIESKDYFPIKEFH